MFSRWLAQTINFLRGKFSGETKKKQEKGWTAARYFRMPCCFTGRIGPWLLSQKVKRVPETEPMATDNGIFFAGISNQGNPSGLRSFRNGLNRFWSALIGCHPSSGCKPTREKTGYLSKARNAGFFSLGRKAYFFSAAGSCCVFSALVTSLQG